MARSIACCAVALALLLPPAAARAKGEALLLAAADTSVQEHRPDQPQGERVRHSLAAGLSRGTALGRSVAYIRFDLGSLPTSTPLEAVVVDEARLSLMAEAFGLAGPERRFLVTVRSCDAADWDETEVTWLSRPCMAGAESESSVIVAGAGLPRVHDWDVARGVARALERGAAGVTFMVTAVPLLDCSRDPFEGIGCAVAESDRIGFVRFASREREAFGLGAVPHLVIRHASEPRLLLRTIETSLAVLSAFALTFGVYKTVRGFVGGEQA